MENNRRELLQAREEEWRKKSRSLWLHSGDENTKFFQAYAKVKEIGKHNMGIKDHTGRMLSLFKDLAQLGSHHFKYLYLSDIRVTIDVVIQMALHFPHFVEEEDNVVLMAEVTEVEL